MFMFRRFCRIVIFVYKHSIFVYSKPKKQKKIISTENEIKFLVEFFRCSFPSKWHGSTISIRWLNLKNWKSCSIWLPKATFFNSENIDLDFVVVVGCTRNKHVISCSMWSTTEICHLKLHKWNGMKTRFVQFDCTYNTLHTQS